MTAAAERVLKDALALPVAERLELAARLRESSDAAATRRDAAWAAEVESRFDAYRAGKIKADTAAAVLARARQR